MITNIKEKKVIIEKEEEIMEVIPETIVIPKSMEKVLNENLSSEFYYSGEVLFSGLNSPIYSRRMVSFWKKNDGTRIFVPLYLIDRILSAIASINSRTNIEITIHTDMIEIGAFKFLKSSGSFEINEKEGLISLPFYRKDFERLFGSIIYRNELPKIDYYEYFVVTINYFCIPKEYIKKTGS